MTRPDPGAARQAAQARLVAYVLAGTIILWMGAQWLGSTLGWPAHFVFLFDFAAMAAFLWALVVTYQLWRKRRN